MLISTGYCRTWSGGSTDGRRPKAPTRIQRFGGRCIDNLLADSREIKGQEVAGLLRVLVLLDAAKSCQMQRTSRQPVYVDQ